MQRRRELMTFEHGHWAIATGSIATFNTPFAKPLRSLKAEFTPVQEGTGDPSPDNIRPITGWTGVNVERRGKNLFDAEKIVSDSNNVRTYIADGFLRFHTGSIRLAWNDINLPCPLRFSGRAKNFSIDGTNTLALNLYFSNGRTSTVSIKSQIPANSAADFSVTIGNSGDVLSSIKSSWTSRREAGFDLSVTQLELGLTATTYEPYNGTTLPIDWSSAGTVYGGYVDLVTGELVQEWYYGYTITHNTNFAIWRNGYNSFWMRNPNSTTPLALYVDGAKNAVCDILKACSNIDIYNARDYGVCVNNSGGIAWRVEGITTVEEMQTWLEAHPLTIGYKLANPIVHQLTPQQITALIGTNSIWSTANGNVTVEYWTR